MQRFRYLRYLTVGAILILANDSRAASESFVVAPTEWNPRPAIDDLVLPLPCQAGITFRKVLTPISDSPIADRRVVLGSEEPRRAMSEFVREAHVAGSFEKGSDAHYWLGKYEVTQGQYEAVMRDCDAYNKLTPAARRQPKTKMTLSEAQAFAEQATVAIYKISKDAIPGLPNARSFLRLPTESEWEFAARGGAAVSDSDFRSNVFRHDGELTTVAQLRRTGQASQLRAIGLLAANPLGFHDILGNVAELVSEPFRLVRGGRLGGKIGGLVARGGDITMTADQIRNSLRIEYPLVTADGELLRSAFIGLRLAIGRVVIEDIASGERMRQAWQNELIVPDGAPATDDPRELAEKLENDLVDPNLRRAASSLRSMVENERSRRRQADERAVKSAIGAGAVLIRSFRNEYRGFLGARSEVEESEIAARSRGLSENRVLLAQRLEGARHIQQLWARSLDTTFNVLSNLIIQQSEIPSPVLRSQLSVWRAENSGEHFRNLSEYAGWFIDEVEKSRAGQTLDERALRERIVQGIR